ncbi:sulfatase-like hydrolase/transferase [Phenylobacterium sp.]|uniref:sulfatase-like hydrolase/transferase n=1 Tax=Phenylobacterium sp. TaxID=1871053 RepID=UPI0025FDA373|nr:sulfatase-like hydrolase/transferase [Phenylobacterium sp.]MBX3483726.1 hypothetical protein [Phenylobacterium sp.]MCW5758142.1 hypothetical protein [Phenylobacterium sp.]
MTASPSVGRSDHGEETRQGRWLTSLLLFSILCLGPTALLFALNSIVGMLGPWINLDLLLVYIAAVLAGRVSQRLAVVLATLGMFATLGIQILVGIGLIYIEDPALILEYLAFAAFWPWRVISLWAGLALVAMLITYLLLSRIRIGRARTLPAVVLLIVFVSLDLFGRTAIGYDMVRLNMATSSAVRLGQLIGKWTRPAQFHVRPFDGETMQSYLTTNGPPPDRILSIAVESFGSAQDANYNAVEIAPLQKALGNDYVVTRALHPYRGATLAGEIRELCGLRISGTPKTAEGRLLRPHCIPAKLSEQGWATLGIHGNSRFFYNRSGLYPAIGFTHTLFFDDLKAQGRRVCRTRAFAGICDHDSIGAALDFMARNPKAFVHIMTLDTHFPLGSRTAGDRNCKPGVTVPSPELCLYQNQITAVMGEIGEVIAKAPVKPDLIFIYGDHAPPYAVASERKYFDRENIPVLILKRRAEADGNAPPV